TLTGAVNVTGDPTKATNAKINVTATGAGLGAGNKADVNSSVWEVTGDSDLRGNLNNTGVVTFKPQTPNTYSTITAEALTGAGGLYEMNTTIKNQTAGRQADLVVATGAKELTTGTGAIVIKNDDSKVAWYQKRMEQALVITPVGSTAKFTVDNYGAGNNNYELGAWNYNLKEGIITKEEQTKFGYGEATIGQTGWHLANAGLSAKGEAALGSVLSPDIWYLEAGALANQMGKFNAKRQGTEMWAQAVHNKLKVNDTINHIGVAGNQVEQSFNGVTVGIDRLMSTGKDGQFWGGLMFGYGTGGIDHSFGNTDNNSAHVGLYGVYKTNSDWYVSGLAKFNRYKTEVDVTGRDGIFGSDEFNQNGWGVAIMAGKKFVRSNGYFIEPQIELDYHKINSVDYNLSGMDVNVDGTTSKRARLGFALGRDHSYQDGAQLSTFFKASLVHEFDGKTDVRLYGEPFETDFSGTWGQFKLGVDFKNAKNFGYNAALTYEKGGRRTSPVGFELGANWTF
ncbi:MAG: autotransporter outer membrane beta-barrel domain-containing protein, partial [Acidaminococcaceae bacterium]